ncbi:hypothetical protein A3I56_00105 [Candidatus Roizmanbacteria bacterium RIFCSPLOWO2_02_FULL_43_10]|uniref:Plasmid stabilization protein n=1 Tax=Candidatus Roizmanbacteria bacterium RIFCSPLOWO2_02_FULL_43_10 TaxID=1802078 RepID=A0A1F7JX72_9BACT|nr:MAG: hypothetical protein A3I56_00105 [Candidatus Roizmanbacteria bacterium RIFCSPLOWO2_02_FULL_43_10]
MQVEYHKNFIKNYRKRYGNNSKIQKQYAKRLRIFLRDSNKPLLRDHSLRGDKITLRAFSITGGIRVVYKQIGDRIIFLDVGTHNQVY